MAMDMIQNAEKVGLTNSQKLINKVLQKNYRRASERNRDREIIVGQREMEGEREREEGEGEGEREMYFCKGGQF